MNNIYTLICMIIVIALSGCSINGTDISKDGTVTIERINSERISIPWADAYQNDNNLTISGILKQRYLSANSLKVYVDVAIRDNNGRLLKEARTADVYVPRKSPCKCNHLTRFGLTVPVVASKGMRICLMVRSVI
jgi:hypothetical protein